MLSKTKIFTIILLIVTSVLIPKEIFAECYFKDDFSNNSLNNWSFVAGKSGSESWEISEDKLIGQVINGGSSFLLTKSFLGLSDYTVNFESSNFSGIDQLILFRVSENMDKYYLLNLRFNDPYWPQDGGEIVLWKYKSSYGYRSLNIFKDLTKIDLSQNQYNKIRIELAGPNIKIFFDNILVIDFVDENDPFLEGRFGFGNWGGDYWFRPTKNIFDNLLIGDFNCGIQDPKPKIIILPGFGASWNSEAIVYNKKVDNDQWKMTPFVKNYDNLIVALEQNNLTKNEDFYVWNYDWRKPVENIVSDLDNFINKEIDINDKLFLVGHSMGGLVSRIWAEDNNDDTRLQKVITLGSPHLGAVEAYEAWSGGEINDLSRFSSIAFNILLELQSLGIKTKMEAVRSYAPSVKDLLPTFKFAIKDDVLLDNDQLVLKNDYLEMKNDNASDLNDKLKLFIGEGHKTLSKVSLRGRTAFDKFFNLWPDGRINKKFNEDGDGTVLIKSAEYKNGDIFKTPADHGNLIDETINQIMTEIGLNQTEKYQPKNNSRYNLKNNLVFFADPVVDYSVWCNEGIPVLNNDGFIVMENKNYKKCYLTLTGKENGISKVVFGNTTNENWTFLQNNIEEGRIVKLEIEPNKGKLLNTRDNLSFIKSMIKKDLDLLMISNDKNKNLIQALKFFNKNNPKLVIKNIFDFQKNNIDEETSSRIINNTLIWMSLTEKCFENKSYRFCSDYFMIGGKYK